MKFNSVNELNVKKVKILEHAIQRAKERVPEWKNMKDEQIIGNLRAILKRATLIGDTVCEKGNPSILFAVDKKALHLSPDLTTMYTIIIHEDITYNPLKEKFIELHKKEMRKLSRTEGARIKSLQSLKVDCDVEIAMLKQRRFKSRSEAVKNACAIRIQAINKTISEYEKEIKAIQDEKRRVAKSLVAVI